MRQLGVLVILVLGCSTKHQPPRTEGSAGSGGNVDRDAAGGKTTTTGGIDGSVDGDRASAVRPDGDAVDAPRTADGMADRPQGAEVSSNVRPDACPDGRLACDAGCFAIDDPRACGSCTHDCSRLPNVAPTGLTCVAGKCGYQCLPPFGDCNSTANGCTSDLSTFYDCGACKNTCQTSTPMCAPATSTPTGFACTVTCPDSTPNQCANGSCVDTQTNLRNCGACSVVCPTNIAHGSVGCIAGKCVITCTTGYDVCRNDCVDFQTDNQNCGGCAAGFACDKLHVCRRGKCECQTQCKDACVDLQTDSANCGTCGHGCLGAACVGGLCQPITLASGQGTPWAIALDATNVYWANYAGGTVSKQPIGGGPTTVLASGLAEPFDLAVDKDNAYVVDRSRVSLLKIPLAGGGAAVTLASGGRDMMNVAVYGGYVYWTEPDADYRGGGVLKVPVEGGGPDAGASTMVSAQYQPSWIAVTSTGIFFLKYAHGEDVVMSIPLSGGTPVVLAAEARNVSDATSIAADTTDVYWTTLQEGRVLKVAQAGGPIVPLASGQASAFVLAIDDTDVYFAGGNASIKRVPKSGGAVTTLANGQGGSPNDMAVDAQAVYWVDRFKMTVMKVAK